MTRFDRCPEPDIRCDPEKCYKGSNLPLAAPCPKVHSCPFPIAALQHRASGLHSHLCISVLWIYDNDRRGLQASARLHAWMAKPINASSFIRSLRNKTPSPTCGDRHSRIGLDRPAPLDFFWVSRRVPPGSAIFRGRCWQQLFILNESLKYWPPTVGII